MCLMFITKKLKLLKFSFVSFDRGSKTVQKMFLACKFQKGIPLHISKISREKHSFFF